MRVTVIGCSGSFSGPASAASSYLVRVAADGRTYNVLFDLGSGALGALQRHLDPLDVDAIFLTHLHPDHCIDIGGLYVFRRYHPDGPFPDRLAIHGPGGARERLTAAYEGMEDGGMDSVFRFHPLADGAVVQVGPLRVLARAVNHPVEAYGFRIEADGQVLAYSGDTDECAGLVDVARGADLLLADSAFIDGRDEAPDIHLSGRRAAATAVAAGARRLMLTHLPSWNDPDVCRAQAAEVWPGVVELAVAGASYEVGD